MTLLLDGLEVTDLRWYEGYDGGDWAKYVCTNRHGYGVGGTISEAEWLRRSVETDDHMQALLAGPDGEAFTASSGNSAAQPAADTAPTLHGADRVENNGGGVLSED